MFGNFRKTSETVQKCFSRFFLDFLKFSGNLRKCSEIFGNGSKVIFRCFQYILKFSENLRKCSEIFGKFPGEIGTVGNGSQELKSFGADF